MQKIQECFLLGEKVSFVNFDFCQISLCRFNVEARRYGICSKFIWKRAKRAKTKHKGAEEDKIRFLFFCYASLTLKFRFFSFFNLLSCGFRFVAFSRTLEKSLASETWDFEQLSFSCCCCLHFNPQLSCRNMIHIIYLMLFCWLFCHISSRINHNKIVFIFVQFFFLLRIDGQWRCVGKNLSAFKYFRSIDRSFSVVIHPQHQHLN